MTKKGFTLIELLAVIVILAIIALIAVPIVLGIIEDARKSATLRSAEFYIDGVEQAVARAMLNGVAIDSDRQYPIMKSGDICLGNYVETDQDGKESCKYEDGKEATLKVEVDGQKPTGGTITLSSGSISSATLTLNSKTIELKDGKLVYVEEKELIPTVASCFEYIDSYDYTINKDACTNAFSSTLESLGTGATEKVCSGDKTFADLVTVANMLGMNKESLVNDGIISFESGDENGNGTISITGYTCGGENGTEKDVVIPSTIDNKPVTKIGAGAFYPVNFSDGSPNESKLINSVVIPDTVTIIEFGAFSDNSLENLTLGKNVTSMAISSFTNNKLTNLTIPSSVKIITEGVFDDNPLKNVTVGAETIGEGSFNSMGLESVVMTPGVKVVEKNAFFCNALKKLSIPNTVTNIGNYAFDNGGTCGLSGELGTITIPDSVVTIGESAFEDHQIWEVIIGKGITNIGNYAFGYGNPLKNVYINRSSSDVTLGESVFNWAEGYNEEVNLHWNSTGPTE